MQTRHIRGRIQSSDRVSWNVAMKLGSTMNYSWDRRTPASEGLRCGNGHAIIPVDKRVETIAPNQGRLPTISHSHQHKRYTVCYLRTHYPHDQMSEPNQIIYITESTDRQNMNCDCMRCQWEVQTATHLRATNTTISSFTSYHARQQYIMSHGGWHPSLPAHLCYLPMLGTGKAKHQLGPHYLLHNMTSFHIYTSMPTPTSHPLTGNFYTCNTAIPLRGINLPIAPNTETHV
jgi:hypothetical protein